MPDREQQVTSLSERVVKEAVGVGMESPLRDPIVEAVEEADGAKPPVRSRLPVAGALLGAGAVVGYLAGRQTGSVDGVDVESIEEPEIVEEVTEELTESEDGEGETGGGGMRRLGRVAVVLAIAAVAILARRRLGDEEGEEWEPIEEFEPAVDRGTEESTGGESEAAGTEETEE